MSRRIKKIIISLFCLSLLGSCSGMRDAEKARIRKMNAKAEVIYRSSDEKTLQIASPKKRIRSLYPWEDGLVGNQLRITKEFFRCQGSNMHPTYQSKTGEHIFDCLGAEQHSLPLREGKEFIYPILIHLLNYVQERTGEKVVITSGHRCPTHNSYVDTSFANRSSKHMIGAEVDFYVEGLESQPEEIIKIVQEYYSNKEDSIFQRWMKETDVSTPPWHNQEVFIKLYKKGEGRDKDNLHDFPYISIQVLRHEGKRINYTWGQAFNGYLRY